MRRRGSRSGLGTAYLRALDEAKVLDAEAEAELAREARGGDAAARERLILANLRLVVAVAKKFEDRAPLDELVAEGHLALLNAAKHYDPGKAWSRAKPGHRVRFSTYATRAINNQLSAFVAEAGLIRLPRWVRGTYKDVSARIRADVTRARHLWSLDVPDDDGETIAETLAARGGDDPPDLPDTVASAVGSLPAAEAEVIRSLYLDGGAATRADVGTKLGMSRQMVYCLERRAIASLRAAAGGVA